MQIKSIWKYQLTNARDTHTLKIPEGALFLSLQTQREVPCLWFLVTPIAKLTERTFVIYGTGWDIEDFHPDARFRGTYQLSNGALVFHVFETTGL